MRTAIYRALIPVLLLTGASWSQNRSTAEIVGTVTDPSGAAVPNTAVKITNTKTGTSVQLTTNRSGAFDAPLLDPGSYTVEFQAPGFQAIIRTGIDLQLDQTARENWTDIGSSGIEGGIARRVSNGDVVIIPGGVPHSWRSLEANITYLIIRADPDNQIPLK